MCGLEGSMVASVRESDLALARRCVFEGEDAVARQREIVFRLLITDRDARQAEALLASMRKSLSFHKEHLAKLCAH